MAYPANLRGWGPGWPTNRINDQVWVSAMRSGVRFQVHHVIAPLIKFLIDEVERRGYWLHVDGDTPDDWSFSSRPIRGRNAPSNHSWGLAIDIDATQYPMGTRKNPPRWIIDLFESYGFEWGGRWKRPDPMHFEYVGSITEARFTVAALAAGHLVNKPAPLPPGAPPLAPPPIPRSQEDPMFVTIQGSGVGSGRFLIIPGGIPVGPMNDAEWMSARKEAPTVPHVTLTKALGSMALYNKRG